MDFKSFSDLVNANPTMRLVFVSKKGGEISPYNIVGSAVKADKVIINLSPVAKKTYEVQMLIVVILLLRFLNYKRRKYTWEHQA